LFSGGAEVHRIQGSFGVAVVAGDIVFYGPCSLLPGASFCAGSDRMRQVVRDISCVAGCRLASVAGYHDQEIGVSGRMMFAPRYRGYLFIDLIKVLKPISLQMSTLPLI
jgi:hypothetical protein